MILRTVFASMACVWAGQGLAQSLSVDANTVTACHDSTPIGEVTPDCIGAAVNACQMQEGGSTTIGTADCLISENAAWDELLNTNYQALRDGFRGRVGGGQDLSGEELNIRLRDAQRAWIAFRDAECGFRYDIYRGGTIRSIVGANCLMTMTAQRALELRDLASP